MKGPLHNEHMISISTLSATDADFIASKEHSAMFVIVIAITVGLYLLHKKFLGNKL